MNTPAKRNGRIASARVEFKNFYLKCVACGSKITHKITVSLPIITFLLIRILLGKLYYLLIESKIVQCKENSGIASSESNLHKEWTLFQTLNNLISILVPQLYFLKIFAVIFNLYL